MSTTETLYQFLNGKKTRFTEFVVNDKPSEQGARKVRYKLLSSSEWQKIQYNNNVTDLQQRVEKSSKGRIGYLHIPAMGSADQARFEREAYEYMLGKDAMIFDVRFNRGGNISDTLIDWLERKPHGIYKSRDLEPEIAPSRAGEACCRTHERAQLFEWRNVPLRHAPTQARPTRRHADARLCHLDVYVFINRWHKSPYPRTWSLPYGRYQYGKSGRETRCSNLGYPEEWLEEKIPS